MHNTHPPRLRFSTSLLKSFSSRLPLKCQVNKIRLRVMYG
jgi:hypothetical protein